MAGEVKFNVNPILLGRYKTGISPGLGKPGC